MEVGTKIKSLCLQICNAPTWRTEDNDPHAMGFYASSFIFWYGILMECITGLLFLVTIIVMADGGYVPGYMDNRTPVLFAMRTIRMLAYLGCICGALHRHGNALLASAGIVCATVVVNAALYIHNLTKVAGTADHNVKAVINNEKDATPGFAVRTNFNAAVGTWLFVVVCGNFPLIWASIEFARHIKKTSEMGVWRHHHGDLGHCSA